MKSKYENSVKKTRKKVKKSGGKILELTMYGQGTRTGIS